MSATPWGRFTTPQPEGFCYWQEGRALFSGAGNNPRRAPSCRLNLRTGEILTLPPNSDTPRDTPIYKLRLDRWTGGGVPLVRVHPFALLHLLVTNQVPATELALAVGTVGMHAVYYSQPFTTPCGLLKMLGVKRAVLAFGTTFDLDVRRHAG